MQKMIVILAGVCATTASFSSFAQSGMYQTGPGGTPPAMYNTPYSPFNQQQQQQQQQQPQPPAQFQPRPAPQPPQIRSYVPAPQSSGAGYSTIPRPPE